MADKLLDPRVNPITLKLLQLGNLQLGLTNDGYGATWEKQLGPTNPDSQILKDALLRLMLDVNKQDGTPQLGVLFQKKF
jgi:hypothetical protein